MLNSFSSLKGCHVMFTLGDTETNVDFARKSKQVLAIDSTDVMHCDEEDIVT